MDAATALGFTLPIGVGMAAIGSATGLGMLISAAMEGISRQPEAADKIQTTMIIGAAFVEALTIYALLVVILLKGFIG